MPWAKAKTSSGVFGPKMASGAISKHQMRVGIYMPLASAGMLTYVLGYKYGGKPDQCNFASAEPEVYLYNTMDIDFIVFLCVCVHVHVPAVFILITSLYCSPLGILMMMIDGLLVICRRYRKY